MISRHSEVLELARQGEWDAAHAKIQPHSDRLTCLIHGYLHRVEGDTVNARYWYRRADDQMPDNTLEEEWERLYKLAQATES